MSEPDPETDLGPKPDAQIEPGEPKPGGADAVAQADGVDGEDATGEPLARDLDPEDNPSTGEIPTEVKKGEDTSTEATRGEAGEGDSYEGSSEVSTE